jgi:predicted metalloprotease with PDZ domain
MMGREFRDGRPGLRARTGTPIIIHGHARPPERKRGEPSGGAPRSPAAMSTTPRPVGALLAFVWLLLAPGTAHAKIAYTLHLDHPEQHSFRVQMIVSSPEKNLVIALPAWNALYQIRDFAYRVREVHAFLVPGSGREIALRKLDKQTWQVLLPAARPENDQIEIDYGIEWNDPGPFNSQLNEHHAFMNLAQILMYVPNRRNEEVLIGFEGVPAGWRAVTELVPAAQMKDSFSAESYDALVDAPVEIGKIDEFAFDNEGVHFRVVVDGKDWKRDRLEDCLRRITGYELQLMSGPPFKEYTFLFHIGTYADVGGGGMEHSYSTAIAATSVESAAAVAAHEFFHAWNVKRIRPQALEPVDYANEQYTRALWFAEGVTSAYAAYALERSGLWSRDQFYGDLSSQISDLEARPARKSQSVEESSLDTWLEKYDSYNTADRSISYYNKGQIIGVLLDLALRDATANHRSLDDVLRRLNVEYARQGKFYSDSEGIRAVVEEVSETSFETFFRRYVAGTEEIPYSSFLAFAGLELKVELTKTADLGFRPERSAGGVTVSAVEPGSAADAAGLRDADVVVSVNGQSVAKNPAAVLRELSPGETIELRLRRKGDELAISFPVGSHESRRYSIAEISHPTDRQHAIREGLLRGTTD